MPSLPAPSDAEVRALAERILERPEYASWHAADPIARLLAWFFKLSAADPVFFWVLVGVLTLLLVAIILHVTWTIRVGMRSRAPAPAASAKTSGPRFFEEAEGLAGHGRFLEAARALHLGVIQKLVRGGRVQLGRAEPNAILRRRLHDAPLGDELRHELVSLLDRLERSWFRDRDEDAQLYECWRRLYLRLDAETEAA